MKIQRILFLFVTTALSFRCESLPLLTDFDVSCGINDSYYRRIYNLCMENTAPSEWVAGLTFQQALEFLRENFNKKFLNERCVEKNEEYRIPKIIHIIWLGSSFPE